MILRRIGSLAALCLILFVATAGAAVLDDIARDFQPLSGYVIMPVQEEFLIDKDADDGVAVGDLFSVVRPGEKVIHPVTGEVLGSLDEVKGILQVTRIKSGYSYARPVQGGGIERADVARRFENVQAAFRDYQGGGEEIYQKLQTALPRLEWQGYLRMDGEKPADAPPLIFVLSGGRLDVLGPEGKTLRSYPVQSSSPPPAAPAASAAPVAVTSMPPATAGAVAPAPPVIETPAASPIIQRPKATRDQVWMGTAVEGEGAGVEVGDFDGDGRQEIAVLYQHRLAVGRLVGEAFSPLSVLDFPVRKGVSLDAADLDGDGKVELYVTAVNGSDLASFVAAYRNGALHLTEEGVIWYFRRLPLPGEGPVLLAQRMGFGLEDFSGPIFRVRLASGRLTEGEAVAAPKGVDLYSFLPFAGPAGETRYARLSDYNHLQILDADGESLYETGEVLGGSEIYIEREDPTKALQTPDRTRNLFIKPHLALGPKGEILVPVNEGMRLFGRYRNFDSSYLLALAWDGQMLTEAWRTRGQKGYMADFRLADADNDGAKEILQVLNYPTRLFSGDRKSVLIAYELP